MYAVKYEIDAIIPQIRRHIQTCGIIRYNPEYISVCMITVYKFKIKFECISFG